MRYVWLRARRLVEIRKHNAVGGGGAVNIGKLESWSDVEAQPEPERTVEKSPRDTTEALSFSKIKQERYR